MKSVDREPIIVDEYTKGRLVYAVDKEEPRNEWLVLIHSVDRRTGEIVRHISVELDTGDAYIDNQLLHTGFFSDVCSHDFYEPTEEEKKYFNAIMKRYKVKFVKPLNKLIWR
jgi:hypothetical protein